MQILLHPKIINISQSQTVTSVLRCRTGNLFRDFGLKFQKDGAMPELRLSGRVEDCIVVGEEERNAAIKNGRAN